jgi:hypothetical protein
MLLVVDHIAAKQIIAPALNTFVGGHSKVYGRPVRVPELVAKRETSYNAPR